MAELLSLRTSVWKEFKLDTKLLDPPVLKLKLKPMFAMDDMTRSFDILDDLPTTKEAESLAKIKAKVVTIGKKNISSLLDYITGWDLTQKGDPIPCNQKQKEAHLNRLMWESIEVDGNKPVNPFKRFLFVQVMNFVREPSNFVKN